MFKSLATKNLIHLVKMLEQLIYEKDLCYNKLNDYFTNISKNQTPQIKEPSYKFTGQQADRDRDLQKLKEDL